LLYRTPDISRDCQSNWRSVRLQKLFEALGAKHLHAAVHLQNIPIMFVDVRGPAHVRIRLQPDKSGFHRDSTHRKVPVARK
jgi:hypothetical protein